MELSQHRRRRKAEVNIVPLVDVLTVLIFFFLLTMQFKEIYAVDVTPPEMKTSSNVSTQDMPQKIVIDSQGGYFFGEKSVDIPEIEEKFAEIAKSENSFVIILSDKETPLRFVTSIIDAAKSAKIKKLSLQTLKQ